jgi:hypothetical protein
MTDGSNAPGCRIRATTAIAQLAPGLETRNLLFPRQERIVHGVLAGAVLAGQVRQLVQPLRS